MPILTILPLKGAVQHYAWGGFDFIPQLLSIDNAAQTPFAELWMGTHQRGMAMVDQDNTTTPLNEILVQHPEYLGPTSLQQFGHQLPYLFKVLDVHKMLSIQAHPSKKQAEEGFARENAADIPLDAPHRNYKDDNHKPELMVALTDFWLLHGFRQPQDILEILERIPAFHPLLVHFQERSIQQLYRYLMELPQSEVDQLLKPLHSALQKESFTKEQPEYWAKQAFADFQLPDGHYDRGIFSVFLFNLVFLRQGQGIYQPAGIPHAYLEGVNMEIMANSDNVFRGGLTPKHIDVPELLKSLVFDPITPIVLEGTPLSTTETLYSTPAREFGLSQIELSKGESYSRTATSPEIILLISGQIQLANGAKASKGDILFVPFGMKFQGIAQEDSQLFRAFVPLMNEASV